jgi:hypothetical protein
MRVEDCSLQNGTHRGKGFAADESVHGRMRLGTERGEENLRMNNVSIGSSEGEKNIYLGK